MRKTTLFLVLAVLLLSGIPVLADGKFYWSESVPPRIPYQRALLLFDGEQETLILQSKYQSTGSAKGDLIGWVVPVPSVPELASMHPVYARFLFEALSRRAQPEVTRISDLLLIGLLLLPFGAILTLLACLLSFFIIRMKFVRRYRARLAIGALALLALVYMAFWLWANFLGGRQGSGQGPAVDVIKAEQVGIYDVQVVKAEQASDLVQWLNQNHFQFDDTDTQVFDQYLGRGWCFVVARIDPSRATGEQEIVSEGLVAPLIMRFQTGAPVYPLALTSTSGHETQILLYVLSEHKWQNDGRLDLHYAGRTGKGIFNEPNSIRLEEVFGPSIEPRGFFSRKDQALSYLTKFKGTLRPEQMKEDLKLTPAKDDEPYKNHVVTW